MVRYVKSLDELIDIIDREFTSSNAVCPICKSEIGTVNIPDVEIGLPELKFTQFRQSGVYCTSGHPIIELEEDNKLESTDAKITGSCRLHIEDIGLKVYEVMKLIKPHLNLDKSMPNAQIYWVLMRKEIPVYTKYLNLEDAHSLLDMLEGLGARVKIIA